MATSNLYTAFQRLVPKQRLLIGEIASVGDVVTVTLISGGSILARGGGGFAVGDRVFVRDGLVEGRAPQMPTHDITIIV